MTPIHAGEGDALLLGPLAVKPAWKNLGIGRRLVRIAVDAARDAGWGAVVLVGDGPYYGPLGFAKLPRGQVTMPRPVDPERMLVAELKEGTAALLLGEVRHARARAVPRHA
jgi:predicted N-acetyltransferase YhbS